VNPAWANKKYRRSRPEVVNIPFTWMDVTMASIEYGTSPETIYRRIKQGLVQARQRDGKWWVAPPPRRPR
jgi:hypothetical protein